MKAEILYTTPNGWQELAGTFILEDGKITTRANPTYETLMKNIYNSRGIGKTGLTPQDDPEAWLRYLPTAYNGAMVRARFVGPKIVAITKE